MNQRRLVTTLLGLTLIALFVILLSNPVTALNSSLLLNLDRKNNQQIDTDNTAQQNAAHNISLNAGWNMISSHIVPTNPALNSVLAGIAGDMEIIKNGQGDVYWPSQGITNNLTSWDYKDGYKIFMNNPATLTINGTVADPATPINLNSGYNLVGYLQNQPQAISQALSSISGSLYLAKNGQGQVYWPQYSIDQIGSMQPGQGYGLYMEGPATLYYQQPAPPTATPDTSCTPTPNNILANPSFESGKDSWSFYTNGSGNWSISNPAYHCDDATQIAINSINNNMQFNQKGFSLQSGTTYRLSFAAYSSSGRDMTVYIHRDTSPYTNYGLSQTVNLSNSWQTYEMEFTASGFSGSTSNSRLRFWFVGQAANNDVYWIDNVVLEPIDGPPPTATPDDPQPTATPDDPQPTATPGSGGGGGGGNNEMLVFDWNQPATEANRGFPHDQPPMENGDWTTPINYADGTFHFRVEIFNQPVPQNMRLQFCVWQAKNGYNFALETCGPQQSITGNSGAVATWSRKIDDMWKKDGKSIEWWRPRHRNGVAIKNSSGQPVSNYNGWNWNGEDPKKWYPLNMRFTVVVVAKGSTFSGWNNHID